MLASHVEKAAPTWFLIVNNNLAIFYICRKVPLWGNMLILKSQAVCLSASVS